ncbi:uncharacterized protein [Oscarella lobularis]|uniref:uncharacterized protein n=1 Tax=Oscarella lobularis TaxID=121494 RepID=UPI003313FC81
MIDSLKSLGIVAGRTRRVRSEEKERFQFKRLTYSTVCILWGKRTKKKLESASNQPETVRIESNLITLSVLTDRLKHVKDENEDALQRRTDDKRIPEQMRFFGCRQQSEEPRQTKQTKYGTHNGDLLSRFFDFHLADVIANGLKRIRFFDSFVDCDDDGDEGDGIENDDDGNGNNKDDEERRRIANPTNDVSPIANIDNIGLIECET